MPTFGVLGVLEVRDSAGELIPSARRKQRELLALLLLRAGTVIGAEEIVDALWGERPPASARANLHSYVHGLRRVLARAAPGAPTRPIKVAGGYRLDVGPGECDAELFELLSAEGRRDLAAGRPAEAAERLARALGLWRGAALLEDLAGPEWILPHAARLQEARLVAMEDQIDARLGLGQYADLVPELAATTIAHPLRERLWTQYIVALHHTCGRAEALRMYERARTVLGAELGVAPGPALQGLHRQVRNGAEPSAAGTAGSPAGAGLAGDGPGGASARPSWSPPGLLPAGVADFTGRGRELRWLRDLLVLDVAAPRVGLTVVGVTGMAGIGKTTLAVHAAHTIAPSFPDGQLYANLRGAQPTPSEPADVLGRFLVALGVHSRAVPTAVDERGELYRTLLAGRRVLVVLDNAASAEQVRALLPGAATCGVLVTSRSRLAAVEGSRWLDLDVFGEDEASRLLARIVDDGRVAGGRAEVADIVRMCGGLPLAVRIAGARLTARRAWPLAHLVALLRDERRRLDRLDLDDLGVRASFALSFNGLDGRARRLIGRLAQFDVPDFPGWLAAVIVDGPDEDTARALESLVDAHLLAAASTDLAGQIRYRFHDLVRLFAQDRARLEEAPTELDAAVQRGLGAWLALAERLETGVPGPCFAPVNGCSARTPVGWVASELAGLDAVTWFDAEHMALRSVIGQAVRTGRDELAFDLAQRLEKYFDLRGMYAEWAEVNRFVLAACQAAGNRRGEAVMLRGLIDVTTWIAADSGTEAMTRSHADALRLHDLFQEIGEAGGMADAAVMCSWALTAMGRRDDAIVAATESLELATRSGHLGGQARAHVALAVAREQSGQLPAAAEHLNQALAAARRLGNPRYEATVLQFLGIAHREAGQLDISERYLAESLEISRRHRDTYPEVLTLLAQARLFMARGDDNARPTATAALAAAREYRMTHHVADSLGLLGELELTMGRPAEAAGHLRESVALWRTRGWVKFQAASLLLLGRSLATLDGSGARAAFEEARTLFVQLEDESQIAEATAQLARLHENV